MSVDSCEGCYLLRGITTAPLTKDEHSNAEYITDETHFAALINTAAPTAAPTDAPTDAPTAAPTAAPSTAQCSDGLKSGDETDIDCGGTHGCLRCAASSLCQVANDCKSGLCEHVAASPTDTPTDAPTTPVHGYVEIATLKECVVNTCGQTHTR